MKKKIGKIEAQIISCLRLDKDKAMTLLYEYYSDSLFMVVNQIINNQENSKDALQETFIKVWQKAKYFNPQKARLYTWLRRIAKHTAIDNIRYYNNTHRNSNKTMSLDENSFLIPSTDVFNIDTIGLYENLAKIQPKYGTIIEAKFLEQFTQRDIAKNTNTPLGTVKARQKIGLRELRKIYC